MIEILLVTLVVILMGSISFRIIEAAAIADEKTLYLFDQQVASVASVSAALYLWADFLLVAIILLQKMIRIHKKKNWGYKEKASQRQRKRYGKWVKAGKCIYFGLCLIVAVMVYGLGRFIVDISVIEWVRINMMITLFLGVLWCFSGMTNYTNK